MSAQHMPRSPVSFDVSVARLPRVGLPVVIDATEEQRQALAREHDLQAVKRYRAELLVKGWKRNGVDVSGLVEADIVQSCVVTLEPIEARIEATVSGVYLPETSKLGREGFEVGGEILVDIDGPDSPELFTGDRIDVGALAEEFFGLAIPPYPRKSDAALPQDNSEQSEPRGELASKLRALFPKE